jgi:hypothetical protein
MNDYVTNCCWVQLLKYFFLLDSTATPVKVGADKFESSKSFKGRMSCLQIYTKALSPSQIHFLKDCKAAKDYQKQICHDGFHYVDGKCYQVKTNHISLFMYCWILGYCPKDVAETVVQSLLFISLIDICIIWQKHVVIVLTYNLYQ